VLGTVDSEEVKLIVIKLFSQNSNLYDHDNSSLQTDGRLASMRGWRVGWLAGEILSTWVGTSQFTSV